MRGPQLPHEDEFDDENPDGRGVPHRGRAWRVVPAVFSDLERRDLAPVAMLIMTGDPDTAVRTRDPHPGAELVDVTTVRFLQRGFGLVAELSWTSLVSLPAPEGWRAGLARDTRTLVIEEHNVAVYTGQIDIAIPPNWYRALFSRESVVLLIASDLRPGDSLMASIDYARRAGNLVGATVGLAG